MSTRSRRAIDLLVAANLAPQELAIEREKSSREGRARSDILGALSSLVPGLASIPGALEGAAAKKAAAELDKQDTLSQIENRSVVQQRALIESQRKADEAKSKAESAAAKAEADKKETMRKDAVQQTRAQLAGGRTEDGGRVGGISRADLEARAKAAGMEPEQLLQEADIANVDEMNDAAKTKKALAPKPGPSAEAVQRQALKDEDTRLSVEQRRRDLAGLKPLAPSESERKQQSGMTSMEKNVADLEADLDAAIKDSSTGTGPVEGRLRDAYTFAFGDEGWSKFQSQAAAVNLQIFGSLRSDAPSEAENKQAEALKINTTDKPDAIKAKLRTIRALIAAKKASPGSRLDQLTSGLTTAPAADTTQDATEMTDEEIEAELEALKGTR